MFQLALKEVENLRCQFGTSSLKAPFATSRGGYGGRRYVPYVFTEQGVAMLSSVLNSPRAIQVNIAIMRAFVKLRQMLAGHRDLARRLDELESKYDAQFRVVFEAILELMKPPEHPPRRIGFHAGKHHAAADRE